jgi:hypothetical protein
MALEPWNEINILSETEVKNIQFQHIQKIV